ncbi:MAG: SAM-dependent chlorinase/fluorinase [Rhodothermales bacterium]|nr:SAM-dependent chlorinase/fluorinase [Rhodothermales bacterium]
MSATSGIITITTDFGTQDGYVAAMKGVMLGVCPDVRFVDVSHDIEAQDVMEGAFVLRNVVDHFPPGTVHLAVVDPGVGTDRRPVAVSLGGHRFVGPDNGLFSLVLSGRQPESIVALSNPDIWTQAEPSSTFHGRDVFAPAAAHLAAGRDMADLGDPVESLASMHWALPISDDQGIQGWVVHVDRFGNCITNISRKLVRDASGGRSFKCYVGNAIIKEMNPTYARATPGDPTLLFNSSDMLEVAIFRDNASELLDIRKGAAVNLVFSDDRS